MWGNQARSVQWPRRSKEGNYSRGEFCTGYVLLCFVIGYLLLWIGGAHDAQYPGLEGFKAMDAISRVDDYYGF